MRTLNVVLHGVKPMDGCQERSDGSSELRIVLQRCLSVGVKGVDFHQLDFQLVGRSTGQLGTGMVASARVGSADRKK